MKKYNTIKIITMICIFLLLGGCRLLRGRGERTAVLENFASDLEAETASGVEFKEFPTKDIYIQIGGCVVQPGVYRVEEGTRLYQVLEMAGGITENGNTDGLFLARVVQDGDRILVPDVSEKEDEDQEMELVNINVAGKERLMTLPGIGEAKALDIIHYREANGDFHVPEDIMKVPGIKENAFQKMKDKIIVE